MLEISRISRLARLLLRERASRDAFRSYRIG